LRQKRERSAGTGEDHEDLEVPPSEGEEKAHLPSLMKGGGGNFKRK